MKSLIIIPAYNEEESIVITVKKLKEELKKNKNYKVDFIVIDDGSSDDTKQILINNNIPYISHIVNMGVGASIKTGIKYAIQNNYSSVMQFDADGQHNGEYVFELIKGLEEGNDIVIGSRFLNKRKNWSLRMIGSKILSNLIWVKSGFKQKITDPTSGQRILNLKVMKDYLNNASSSEPSFAIKYHNKGFKVKEILVEMNEREYGESHFNLSNSVKFMVEQVLAIVLGY